MKEFIHIIEYEKRGPLWQLINGLTGFNNHKILETRNRYVDLSCYDNNIIFVFHTSGKDYPMISALESFFSKRMKCIVFIHTLPDYIKEKGFESFLKDMKDLQNRYRTRIVVPSKEASLLFREHAIDALPVNLGIPRINICNNDVERLAEYTNRIITVSTKNTEKYMYAKGIDRFLRLMESTGKIDNALILGCDAHSYIKSARLTHDDFLYVLSKAKAYIQLSRSESYNISAIEAKQLKTPILVSDCTGHKSNIKDNSLRVSSLEEAADKLNEILNNPFSMKEKMEYLYHDSLLNENNEAFKNRIENIL